MTHSSSPPTARHVKIARSVPLIAAIIAPLVRSSSNSAELHELTTKLTHLRALLRRQITLLDIPALSQRWFLSSEGKPEPDPATSIGLSIVSLGE